MKMSKWLVMMLVMFAIMCSGMECQGDGQGCDGGYTPLLPLLLLITQLSLPQQLLPWWGWGQRLWVG